MDIKWNEMLLPSVSPLEIVLRGSVMYLALYILLRVILKRQAGTLGMTDLLLITLIADASQNGMAGDYKSLPDGILLAVTIIAWTYALDWLSFRSPWFTSLIEPPPLLLIKDGQLMRKNMRQELITAAELESQVREQGIDDVSQVKAAYIESNGKISVIKAKEGS